MDISITPDMEMRVLEKGLGPVANVTPSIGKADVDGGEPLKVVTVSSSGWSSKDSNDILMSRIQKYHISIGKSFRYQTVY